jgi:hypothetical protein
MFWGQNPIASDSVDRFGGFLPSDADAADVSSAQIAAIPPGLSELTKSTRSGSSVLVNESSAFDPKAVVHICNYRGHWELPSRRRAPRNIVRFIKGRADLNDSHPSSNLPIAKMRGRHD